MTFWDFMNEHWIVGPATLLFVATVVAPCVAWTIAVIAGQRCGGEVVPGDWDDYEPNTWSGS